MASLLKAGRLLSFSAVAVFSALSITVSPVFAATAQNVTAQPEKVLRYDPKCSDATSALSYWYVSNDNQTPVEFSWNNVEHGKTGTITALPGQSVFTTDYVVTDGNNRTEFTTVNPVDHVSRNATAASCGDDVPEVTPVCVDGTMHDNLMVEITADNLANVETKSGLPVCDDMTLFYSSYEMPANYDGNGFFLNGDVNTPNRTAYTQYKVGSTEIKFEAGDIGYYNIPVKMPNSCVNTQLDVYYGPEFETVGPTGHGTQNLLSKILPSTGACPTPGQGGGDETPVTPPVVTPPVVTPPVTETPGMGGGTTTPVAPTPAQPTQLANTGSDTSLPYLVALSILLATSAVALIGRKASRA